MMKVIIECIYQQIKSNLTSIQLTASEVIRSPKMVMQEHWDSLLSDQNSSLLYGSLILLPYVFLLLKKFTRARLYSTLAFLLCATVTMMFYNELSNIEVYCVFGFIYALTAISIMHTIKSFNLKIVSASFWCCIMGILNITMAVDAHFYAKTETFIWQNYETFVYIIHFFILASFSSRFTKWCRDCMDFIINNLLSLHGNKVNS